MKKKFYGLITAILLLVTCFGFAACKGKYDDMDMRILYAFSEDATDWYDGTDGIEIFHGNEDDELQFMSSNFSKIYLKVEVRNVKEKYIDDILISTLSSDGGATINAVHVFQNQIFEATVGPISHLTVSVKENNSGFKKQFDIDVSKRLTGLSADLTALPPAVVVGGQIDLNKISVLRFTPSKAETRQTALSYSIEGVGSVYNNDLNSYRYSDLVVSDALSLNGTILSIDANKFNEIVRTDFSSCYAIKIKATSQFYPEMSTYFFVYMVDYDATKNLTVKYSSNSNEIADSINLYLKSEGDNSTYSQDYSTTKVALNAEAIQSAYVAGLPTPRANAKYEISASIDGEGVTLEELETNLYQINLSNKADVEQDFCILRFEMHINGLDFSASNSTAVYYKEIVINKKYLPGNINLVNKSTNTSETGTQLEKNILSSANYQGLSLSANIDHFQDIGTAQIFVENIVGLNVSGLKSDQSKYYISNYGDFVVSFKQDYAGQGSLNLNVPYSFDFEGENQTGNKSMSIKFTKIVTADTVDGYKNQACSEDKKIEFNNQNNPLILGMGVDNEIYLKVAYQPGANFDANTVKLFVNDDRIKFSNNLSNISLIDCSCTEHKTEGYSIYTISFANISNSLSTSLNIVVGDDANSVFTQTIYLKSVRITSDAKAFEVRVKNNSQATKIETIGNEHLNYAIPFATNSVFEVFGKTKNLIDTNADVYTTEVVKSLTATRYSIADLSTHFSTSEVRCEVTDSASFYARGQKSGITEIFNLNVEFYVYNPTSKEIEQANTDLILEFAVYTPIKGINSSLSRRDISYIETEQGVLEEFSRTTLTYSATFIENVELENANELYFYNSNAENNEQKIVPFTIGVEIPNDESVQTKYSGGVLDASRMPLSGAINFELVSRSLNSSLDITLCAYMFNQKVSGAEEIVVIRIKNYETAQRINLSADDSQNTIVYEGVSANENIYSVYLSFLNKNVDTASFYAELIYNANTVGLNRLGYKIEQVRLNDEQPLYSNGELQKYDANNAFVVEFEQLENQPNISLLKITANQTPNVGGYYILTIYSLDSYDGSGYTKSISLNVYISDGVNYSYILRSVEDFEGINTNLSAKFVLGTDLVLSGDQVIKNTFTGRISGQYSVLDSVGNVVSTGKHSITVDFSEASVATIGQKYMGLFAQLGNNASVENLSIKANFGTKGNLNFNSTCYVGALAGYATLCRITNVDVEYFGAPTFAGSTSYFGGLVGYANQATINLQNSTIVAKQVEIFAENGRLNFGVVVGSNGGGSEISGSYLGKESLNSVEYNAISNVEIHVGATGAEINAGGIAGENPGQITNIILGGQIEIVGSSTSLSSIYLGGIVGNNSGILSNVAALGLDLTNNYSNGGVGGIVGKSTKGSISNARFMSAYVNFGREIPSYNDNLGTDDALISYGKIKGYRVAGIAAENVNTSISYSTVESFLSSVDGNVFYSLEGTTVAGISFGTPSISNSFVSANINATIAYPTSNSSSESNTYFLGRIVGSASNSSTTYTAVYDDNSLKYNNSNIAFGTFMKQGDLFDTVQADEVNFVDGDYYILESGNYVRVDELRDGVENYYKLKYSATNIYSVDAAGNYLNLAQNGKIEVLSATENYYHFDDAAWTNLFSSVTSRNNWRIQKGYNIVNIKGIKLYFPYLIDSHGEELMVVRPTSITARVDDGENSYAIKTGAIVVNKSEVEFNINNVSQVVIVNFHTNNDLANPERYNSYYLINKINETTIHSGLIDLSILPTNAQSGIRFEIVSEGNYAYITADDRIVFTKASNTNPIVVRVYSVFDEKVEAYVAFFARIGMTNLLLTGEDVVEYNHDDADYLVRTHIGADDIKLTLAAENIYEGQRFADMLSATSGDDGIFEIKHNGEYVTVDQATRSIILNYNDLTFEGTSVEKHITISLYLNLTKYFGTNFFPQKDGADQLEHIRDITIQVLIYKTTKNLIASNSEFMFSTSSSVEFTLNLETDYISNDTNPNNWVEVPYTINSNEIRLSQFNHDSIVLTFVGVESDALTNYLNSVKGTSIANLFNYEISYKYLFAAEGDTSSQKLGYTYKIKLTFKDETEGVKFKYVTEEFALNLIATSTTNAEKTATISLKVKPTPLSTAIVNNYETSSVSAGTEYTQEVLTKNSTNTFTISPRGLGSVMVIHLQPNYAYVNEKTITLKSSKANVVVDGVQTEVSLVFKQLLRNEGDGSFVTYGSSGSEINLSLYSNSDLSYDGIIYVRVYVSQGFSGQTKNLDATLSLETCELDENLNVVPKEVEITSTLITEYLPGASLVYSGQTYEDGYLVQTGTFNNNMSVELYGYQLNSNPTIDYVWNLNNNSKYHYKQDIDGNPNRTVIVDESGKEYRIGDYVSTTNFISVQQIDEQDNNHYRLDFLLRVQPNTPTSFKVRAQMSLKNNSGLVESGVEREIIFYPANYVVTEVYFKNLNNGKLISNVYESVPIEIGFSTKSNEQGQSESVYAELVSQFGLEKLKKAFTYIKGGQTYTLNDENPQEFTVGSVTVDGVSYLTLKGVTELLNLRITLNLRWSYLDRDGDGLVEIIFENVGEVASFEFSTKSTTTEEAPIALYNRNFYDVLSSAQGGDYILLEDIVLGSVDNPYLPFDAKFASLDGNNKTIKILNFAPSATLSSYGLFSSIGVYETLDDNDNAVSKQTILKNVVVDYSEFAGLTMSKNEQTEFVFGGLVGTNNGGLIYNCDVMNFGAANKTVNIVLSGFQNTEVVFGGLVGRNQSGSANSKTYQGAITNSRVGRIQFTRILAGINQRQTVQQLDTSPLTFVLGNTNPYNDSSANGFVGIAGGFVGQNRGIIASCYVANTSLINYSIAEDNSRTAGFAGENDNGAKISFSYVKALESTLNNSTANCTGAEIKSARNGNVAGFVHINNGNINNCFANTEVKSDSAFLAGFVYQNGTQTDNVENPQEDNGVIETSYAACTFTTNNVDKNVAVQPFVGATKVVDGGAVLLSYGTIKNCYYYVLTDTQTNEDLRYNLVEGNGDQAKALNQRNFANPNQLSNFVFITSENREQTNQGVWDYYKTSTTTTKSVLPELTSANQIAHSFRFLTSHDELSNTYVYENAPSYNLGGKNNPNIIRDYEEYNDVMTARGLANSMTGYIRLINNIDFSDKADSISTRANFTLGNARANAGVTSLEGNGMSIERIYLDVQDLEDPGKDMGLISYIQNSYVKNITLSFTPDKFSTSPTNFSGGLAGRINSSVLININIDGASTTIIGNNLAGGLAGLITGESLLYGITSNVNVNVGYKSANIYYSETEYSSLPRNMVDNTTSWGDYLERLSYAGGVVGVLDILSNQSYSVNDKFNVSYIDVLGNEMVLGENQSSNIDAYYVGGIAGYASYGTNALKLRFYYGEDTRLEGDQAVGGLYGIGLGRLTASQVSGLEDDEHQFAYDTALGRYILDLEADGLADASFKNNSGNLTLISSGNYAGGLVGIGLVSSIYCCYSKSSVYKAKTFGGLIGLSIGSTITYSYAVPYINLSSGKLEKVGGLLGIAYSVGTAGDKNQEYVAYLQYLNGVLHQDEKYTDIAYTFSTLLLDNNEIQSLLNGEITNDGAAYGRENITLDYVCADYYSEQASVCHLQSDRVPLTSGKGWYVYVGYVNHYATDEQGNQVVEFTAGDKENVNMSTLYNSEDPSSQEALFTKLFSGWPREYWQTLDYKRYFPLLINKEAINYIPIYDADDFEILVNNPDLDYMVMNDIDMKDWDSQSNWIFNVNFTGTLTSFVSSENEASVPRIYNLHLTTVTSNESSGLFRETTNAKISSLNFVWYDYYQTTNNLSSSKANSAINIQTPITMVGGLSCMDTNSEFSHVNVYSAIYRDEEILFSPSIYFVNNNDDAFKDIEGFGGLVAKGTNSTINNCNFNGNVNVKMNKVSAESKIYFGGLVGEAQTTDVIDSLFSGFTITGCGVGINNETPSGFTISLQENAGVTPYIGGAVGHIFEGAIRSVNIFDNYNNAFDINVNISAKETVECPTIYLAGIAGFAENSTIIEATAKTNITAATAEGYTANALSVSSAVGKLTMAKNSLVQDGDEQYESSFRGIHTKSNINLTKASITTLVASHGIAELSCSGTFVMENCLFAGEITSEQPKVADDETQDDETQDDDEAQEEATPISIKNIYAGGAVAYFNGSTIGAVQLSKVTTYVDLILGSLNNKDNGTIYMAGLVGQSEGRTIIDNCATAGRIVPLTTQVDANKVYIAGMVGKTTSLFMQNSYSTSSVILDGLDARVLYDIHKDALVAGVDNEKTVNNVYYSSDISLQPSDVCTDAKNYSADLLLHPSAINKLNLNSNNNVWLDLNDNSSYYLPYLSSLRSALVEFGILNLNGNTATNYRRGSSLNPITITALNFDNINNYYYYIFAGNSLQLSFDINLNGFIIGANEITISGFAEGTEELQEKPFGIFASVAPHSAVSNFNIKLDDNFNLFFNGASNGLIAGSNSGVVFNCSVMGAGITVGQSATSSNINGLIVGENNGLVAYCYSAAEIVNSQRSVSGIVYNNFKAIDTCYFTGYINNTSSQSAVNSAGIVCDGNGYVYNSYMAGVLTNIRNNANAFALNNIFGRNNYIDINVNKQECKKEDTASNTIILQTVETSLLMSNKATAGFNGLKGNWATSVVSANGGSGFYADLNSATYGYNYLYPIYNFNKYVPNNDRLPVIKLTNHQLYTGTGANTNDIATSDLYDEDFNEVLASILTPDSNYYHHAFKVPHLGVLKAVQGIINTYVKNGDSTEYVHPKLNYVLIYDIDGEYYVEEKPVKTEWTAVGSSTQLTNGFITNDAQFNGLFISNKFYNFTPLNDENGKDEKLKTLCTVKNLTGNGLFDNINQAYIGYLKLGDFTNLSDSGAIGVKVIGGEAFVNDVYYLTDTHISGLENGVVAAMFGTIGENANLTITNTGIEKSSSLAGGTGDYGTNGVDISNAAYAGFVAGRMSGGTIKFGTGNAFSVIFTGTINFAGGFVGEMQAGTMLGETNKTTIEILNNSSSSTTAYSINLGGLVGSASNATSTTSPSLTNLGAKFTDNLAINGLGGLAYSVNIDITFSNCVVEFGNTTALDLCGAANNPYHYFGGLVAAIGTDTDATPIVTVEEFSSGTAAPPKISIKSISEKLGQGYKEDTQAFGGLVGLMNNGTIKFSLATGSEYKPTITVDGANVGGIVGYMKGGTIDLSNSVKDNFFITLEGVTNVGGAFGYFAANINQVLPTNGAEWWNFLQSETAFATIQTPTSIVIGGDFPEFANWGGIFGYFDGDLGAESRISINNRNNINIGLVMSSYGLSSPVLLNVGGVAGRIKGQNNSLEISNSGSITTSETNDGLLFGKQSNVGEGGSPYLFKIPMCAIPTSSSTSAKYAYALLATNVGGVFGKVDKLNADTNSSFARIYNAKNESDVQITGYQNVGGLIGYADVIINRPLDFAENDKTSAAYNVYGVVNVGGAIGLLNGGEITYFNINVNVYGNYNVGGLVGYIASGRLEYNNVGNFKDNDNVEMIVKGIYLDVVTSKLSSDDNTNQNKDAYFFPGNVGGLFGANAVTEQETSNITIGYNKIKKVNVLSSDEGALDPTTKFFNEALVISTFRNPMLYGEMNNIDKIASETPINLTDIVTRVDVETNSAPYINKSYYSNFNQASSGFGGLAGSTDAKTMLKAIPSGLGNDQSMVSSNEISDVVVKAGAGINVGGIFGYYFANTQLQFNDGTSTTNYQIATPNILGDIKVTGAYRVGGIAGYLNAGNYTVGFNTAISSTNPYIKAQSKSDTATIYPTIKVQADATVEGMYVGGLFGMLKGTAENMKVVGTDAQAVQLTINVGSNLYVGGLIGRLEGNLLGDITTNIVPYSIGQDPNDKENDKPTGLDVTGDTVTNFGGLVGMLKVTTTTSKNENQAYEVSGWHPYAFTINTIENQNYSDGTTQYSYNDDDASTVDLIAQAYYVNQDKFEISYSRGGAPVGEDLTYTENRVEFSGEGILKFWFDTYYITNSLWFGNLCNNPLHPNETFGWAKDYTMFRIMQRNIPQTSVEWDAISVVYDADNITYVATPLNSSRDDGGWIGSVMDNLPPDEKLQYELLLKLLGYSDSEIELLNSLTGNLKDFVKELANYGAYDAKNTIYSVGQDNAVETLYDHYVVKDEDGEPMKDDDGNDLFDKAGFNNHIFYTIYDRNDSDPLLYSRMGIADIYRDNEGNFTDTPPQSELYGIPITDNQDGNKTKHYLVGNIYYDVTKSSTPLDADGTKYQSNTLTYLPWYFTDSVLWKKVQGNKDYENPNPTESNFFAYCVAGGTNGLPDAPTYPETIKCSDGIYYHIPDKSGKEIEITEQNIRDNLMPYFRKDDELGTGYQKNMTEYVTNYHYDYTDDNDTHQVGDVSYTRSTDFVVPIKYSAYGNNGSTVWFIFQTLFENYTSSVDGGSPFSDAYLPEDGSVLGINGLLSSSAWGGITKTEDVDYTEKEAGFWDWFWDVICIGSLIASLLSLGIIAFFSGGVTLPLLGAFALLSANVLYTGSKAYAFSSKLSAACAHYESKLISDFEVKNLSFERRDLSQGLLSFTSKREIYYIEEGEGDKATWRLQSALSDTEIIDGEFYYYYSSTRPTDFYSKYYTLINPRTDDGKPFTAARGQVEGDYPGYLYLGDGQTYYTIKYLNDRGIDSDHCCVISQTYKYYNGVYYINSQAADINRVAAQMNFDSNAYNKSQYIQNSAAYYYVQGSAKFKDGKYDYTMPNSNLTQSNLYLDGNIIRTRLESGYAIENFSTITGGVAFSTISSKTYSAIQDLNNTAYPNEQTGICGTYLAPDSDDSIAVSSPSEQLYLGYGYMKGVYMAVRGNKLTFYDTNDPMYEYYNSTTVDDLRGKKFYIGVFSNRTEEKPSGKENVDYITSTCIRTTTNEDGTPTSSTETYYYSITDVLTEDAELSGNIQISDYYSTDSLKQTLDGKDATPKDTFYVKLYPYALTNPYTISAGSEAFDENVYFLCNEVLDSTHQGLTTNVTYYYYDGGYVVKSSFNKDASGNLVDGKIDTAQDGQGNVYLKYLDKNTLSNEFTAQYGASVSVDDALANAKLNLYNKAGSATSVSFADLLSKFDVNNYKDYYIKDPTQYLDSKGNDTLASLKLKVSNNYIVENGVMYKVTPAYEVYNGMLYKVTNVVQTALDDDYNRNKYLANSKYQIYTRYKFTNGVPVNSLDTNKLENIFGTLGIWVYSEGNNSTPQYYLFNPNHMTASPNEDNNKTLTYLTESLLITLGGGGNVTTGNNMHATAGSFTAK